MSKKFKEAMPIGSKWRIYYDKKDLIVHGNTGRTILSGTEGSRTVIAHRSKDMILQIGDSGTDKDGVHSYLTYPKAHFWKKEMDDSIVVMHDSGSLLGTRNFVYVPFDPQ